MRGLWGKNKGKIRAGLAAALALSFLGVTPALAEDDPTLWYFDRYGVAEAHAEGYTGKGVKIAVIDSQINPNLPEFAGANLTVKEPSYCEASLEGDRSRLPAVSTEPAAYHGTGMVSLLISNGNGVNGLQAPKGVAPDAEVTLYATSASYKEVTVSEKTQCYRDGKGSQGNSLPDAEAINDAIDDGADIISMSFTGPAQEEVKAAFIKGVRKGVIFVAGTSNDLTPTLAGELAALNGLVTIQALDANAQIQSVSNSPDKRTDVVGPGVDIKGIETDYNGYSGGSGTSNATAITSGFLALLKSKYPNATGNQLLQSLIHNTGAEDHELSFDETGYWGYGPVSLKHMLREDPAQYPDVNPLVAKEMKRGLLFPSYEEIFGTDQEATASAPPVAAEDVVSSEQPSDAEGIPLIRVVIFGLLGSLVLAVIGLIVGKNISKRRRMAQPTHNPSYPDLGYPITSGTENTQERH